MMRYHTLYHDFNGNDISWATKVSKSLQCNEWDNDTPLLLDGNDWSNTIRNSAFIKILSSLRINTTIQSCIIRNWIIEHEQQQNDNDNNNINDALLLSFKNAFHENSTYRSLSIRNMTVTNNHMDHNNNINNSNNDHNNHHNTLFTLPETIFLPRDLREVTLEGCYLNERTCIQFANVLQCKECKLRSLEMKNMQFENNNSIKHIGTAISYNKSLRYVTIKGLIRSDNEEDDEDAINHLLLSFGKNQFIQLLELEDMNLNVKHSNSIAILLQQNNSIEILSLRKNQLNSIAIETIMKHGIVQNHTLQTLYLSDNNISINNNNIDISALSIVYGISNNDTLHELCLRNCNISYNGCIIIAKGLSNFRNIRYLNMSQNHNIYLCGKDILYSLQNYNNIIHCILPDKPSQRLLLSLQKQLCQQRGVKKSISKDDNDNNLIHIWDHIEQYLRLNRANRKAIRDLNIIPSYIPYFMTHNNNKIMNNPDILYHFIQNLIPSIIIVSNNSSSTTMLYDDEK